MCDLGKARRKLDCSVKKGGGYPNPEVEKVVVSAHAGAAADAKI